MALRFSSCKFFPRRADAVLYPENVVDGVELRPNRIGPV